MIRADIRRQTLVTGCICALIVALVGTSAVGEHALDLTWSVVSGFIAGVVVCAGPVCRWVKFPAYTRVLISVVSIFLFVNMSIPGPFALETLIVCSLIGTSAAIAIATRQIHFPWRLTISVVISLIIPVLLMGRTTIRVQTVVSSAKADALASVQALNGINVDLGVEKLKRVSAELQTLADELQSTG